MYNELELFKRYEDINDAEVINEFIYIKSIRTRRKLKSGMLKQGGESHLNATDEEQKKKNADIAVINVSINRVLAVKERAT